MKKDINFPQVEKVYIAITQKINDLQLPEWEVYVINRNPFPIHNLLITSKGYGHKEDGEKLATSTLRHHFDDLGADEYALIEPIDPALFELANEFWLSYYVGKEIFDKKFIFVPGSIMEENLVFIPQLQLKGVMHS